MMYEIRPPKLATAEIKIKDADLSVEVEVEIKPRLMARKCASCGRFFDTPKDGGKWFARMEPAMKLQGNYLNLDCCSFACATSLESGGWMDPDMIDHDREHTNINYFICEKAEVGSSSFKSEKAKYEAELVEEWENIPDLRPEDLEIRRRCQAGVIRFTSRPVGI